MNLNETTREATEPYATQGGDSMNRNEMSIEVTEGQPHRGTGTTGATAAGQSDRDIILRKAWSALRKVDRGCRYRKEPESWFAGRLLEYTYDYAGHVAAYAFFDSTEPWVYGVTIIPEKDYCEGLVLKDGFYRLLMPGPSVDWESFNCGEELRAMVIATAGDAAKAKGTGDDGSFEAWLNNSGNLELRGPDGALHVGRKNFGDMSDEERVWYAVRQMPNGVSSAGRIAGDAHSLAVDLLAIPEVWACVCAIADRLLTKGELGGKELRQLCAPIRGMVRLLPEWRERFDAFVRSNQFSGDVPELAGDTGSAVERSSENAA